MLMIRLENNVHYSLAIQLRDVTQRAKKFEKEFIGLIRQQYKTDIDDQEGDGFDDEDFEDGKVEMKFTDRLQQKRTKEIEEIVTSTNELAALFKELSVLVIEQGTILDRIDAHIEESLQHTKKGKKHLVEAKKASESSRARSVIM
jgi:syntaxin 16